MHMIYKAASIFAILFFLTGPAQACRFIPDQRPLADRMADYKTVFIGSVKDTASETGTGNADAVFAVQLAIKGALKTGDAVKVESHVGSCAHSYQPGQIWLIVALEEKAPYTTHMADASVLISHGPILPAAGWAAIKPLLTEESRTRLADANPCARAILALDDYFEALPRACDSDSDCHSHYINPIPCQPGIAARQDAITDGDSLLLQRQQAVRNNCPFESTLLPACEATDTRAVCYENACRNVN